MIYVSCRFILLHRLENDILKTIILTLLVFGLIIVLHEFGHFIFAKLFKVRVNEFSFGMGPKIFGKRKGETLYSIRAFPIGGYVSMEGEDDAGAAGTKPQVSDIPQGDSGSVNEKPVWQRFIIFSAGAVMNLLLGLVILTVITANMDLLGTNIVASFRDDSVTSQYLKTEDRIVSVNGHRTASYNDVIFQILRDEDGQIDLTVVRDKQKQTLSVPFRTISNENGGMNIDLDFMFYGVKGSFSTVVPYAVNWTVSVVKQVWFSLVDIVTGRYGLNDISGPVGTAEIIGEVSSQGMDSFFMLIAFITINVGVFNLLPIPALDGGRILFLIIEGIFRKPVPQKYEGIIHAIGFMLLILLIIVVTFNDILKLVTG